MELKYKRRLNKLADAIEHGLPDTVFHMGFWHDKALGTGKTVYNELLLANRGRRGCVSLYRPEAHNETRRYIRKMGKQHCGTIACIGGHGEILFAKQLRREHATIQQYLGLSDEEVQNLFYMENSNEGEDAMCKAHDPVKVAQVIRNFAKTGVVDWSPVQ